MLELLEKKYKSTFGGIWSQKWEFELYHQLKKSEFDWLNEFKIPYSFVRVEIEHAFRSYGNKLAQVSLVVKSRKNREVQMPSLTGLRFDGVLRGAYVNYAAQGLCLLKDDYWAKHPELNIFIEKILNIASFSKEELKESNEYFGALKAQMNVG